MTKKQPEALRLAGLLELAPEDGVEPQTAEDAAAELRRLHTENTALQQGYAAARLEIESLQVRIKTMAEEHADELMVAHLDGRAKAAQQPGAAYAALPYKQALGSTNCMQCCVSYMMGLPLESVPNFATAGGWDRFASFAESQGYAAVMLPGNREYEADYLASGTTARGTSHMVVMNDGKLVHDPHPSNEGLVDVQCVWLLAKRASSTQVRQDEHAAFEASAKTYTANVSFERDASDYVDMTASLLWHGWKLRASHGQAPAQAAPPHFGDEAHVAIPQMLLCAACSAIDKKRDGTKVLAELRRYTTGDLAQAIAPAPAAMAAPQPAPQQEALRLAKYVARRKLAKQLDTNEIHSLDSGCDTEAVLLLSDIEAVLAQVAALTATQPAAPQQDADEIRSYAAARAWIASASHATADSVTAPAGGVAAGIEAAAQLLERKADDFAREHGSDDLGSLSFGRGTHADAKLDYHSTLLELAEEIRSLAPTPPAQAADSVPEDAARYRYLRDVPMDQWPAELLTAIRLQQNAKWDTNIDAARAAQEGK